MVKRPIAIVGDFKPDNPSHAATNEAIGHASEALGFAVEYRWVGTENLVAASAVNRLQDFSGVWMAPATPYQSTDGALLAVRFARERGVPLLGTCGGFQHIILEYARNVLGIADAQHEESDPEGTRLVISRLPCSLVGRTLTIELVPGSLVARLYARTTVQERYHCNFGVNPDFVDALLSRSLRIVGSDAEGIVRVVELPEHPFFVGTLFLPQLSSSTAAPHPLVLGFIKACMNP